MQWDTSNIENIVNYINLELESGRSMASIEREEFNCNPRTISKRLKRLNYIRVENKYVFCPSGQGVRHEVRQGARREVRQPVITNENRNINALKRVDAEKLMGLVNRYDEILELLNKSSNVKFQNTDGITIMLPTEIGKKDARATVRVNSIVWERFDNFCIKNKAFSKKDLLSQALVEFMEKHD